MKCWRKASFSEKEWQGLISYSEEWPSDDDDRWDSRGDDGPRNAIKAQAFLDSVNDAVSAELTLGSMLPAIFRG